METTELAAGRANARLDLAAAAVLESEDVLGRLGSGERGLTAAEARRRLDEVGPNVLRSHGARFWSVLARQFRSFLLVLLLSAAVVSAAVGETTEAGIILTIVCLSVGLGFLNEFRSEKAVEALHSQIRRTALVERDGRAQQVDVVELVPGDLIRMRVGDIVPADLRLLESSGLECDESALTGESAAAAKRAAPGHGDSPLDLPSCVFMGTVVHSGEGRAVVVQTGSRTAFGAGAAPDGTTAALPQARDHRRGGIALRLGERHEQTAFQRGLQSYSRMLVIITGLLAGSIFVVNALLGRSLLPSLAPGGVAGRRRDRPRSSPRARGAAPRSQTRPAWGAQSRSRGGTAVVELDRLKAR